MAYSCRRETYITVPHGGATDEEEEEEGDGREEDLEEEVSLQTPVKDSSNQGKSLGTVGEFTNLQALGQTNLGVSHAIGVPSCH